MPKCSTVSVGHRSWTAMLRTSVAGGSEDDPVESLFGMTISSVRV